MNIIDVSEYQPRKIPSKTWRDYIKKIYEADPLICPRCQGEMKIISFITERPVIKKILNHQKQKTTKDPPGGYNLPSNGWTYAD